MRNIIGQVNKIEDFLIAICDQKDKKENLSSYYFWAQLAQEINSREVYDARTLARS